MTRKKLQSLLGSVPVLFAVAGCSGEAPEQATFGEISQALTVTNTQLTTFQEFEAVPNVALSNPQEVNGSTGQLKRTATELSAKLKPKSLPAGAYTFWWHLNHTDGESSILFASSAIVGASGNTTIDATLPEGEENAPGLIFTGHGLQEGEAETVDVEIFVRYHGTPATDPTLLDAQTSHPFGGCMAAPGLNPNPLPSDYPCWNPQIARFGSP